MFVLRGSALLTGLLLLSSLVWLSSARAGEGDTYFFISAQPLTRTTTLVATDGGSPLRTRLDFSLGLSEITATWLPTFDTILFTDGIGRGTYRLFALNINSSTPVLLAENLIAPDVVQSAEGDAVFVGQLHDDERAAVLRIDTTTLAVTTIRTLRDGLDKLTLAHDTFYLWQGGATYTLSIDGRVLTPYAEGDVLPLDGDGKVLRYGNDTVICATCEPPLEAAPELLFDNRYLLAERALNDLYGELVLLDLQTLAYAKVTCDERGMWARYALAADTIIYARGGSSLLTIDPFSGACERIELEQFRWPMLGSDTHLLYLNSFSADGSTVFQVNVATQANRPLYTLPDHPNNFTRNVSPDNQWLHLSYVNNRLENEHVRLHVDTGAVERLPNGEPIAFSPLVTDVYTAPVVTRWTVGVVVLGVWLGAVGVWPYALTRHKLLDD